MEEKGINLFDYTEIISRRRKFIIFAVLIITTLALGISLILPKWYKATAVLMPPSGKSGSFGNLGVNLGLIGLGDIVGGSTNQYRLLAILKSNSLLTALDEKFDFQSKYNSKFKFKTYEAIQRNMELEIQDEEQLCISFLDQDQELVVAIVDFMITYLDSVNIVLTSKKAKFNREFVEGRIAIVMDSLYTLENEIINFMEQNNIISISDQLSSAVEKAAELKAKIVSKEIELALKENQLSPQAPEIEILNQEINILKSKYDEFFSDNNDRLFINFSDVPDIEMKYIQLKRKAEYFARLLEFLAPQYEQAKIEEIKDIPTIQVLDYPSRPEWKTKPKRAFIVIIAFMVSLIISFISVIFYDVLKQTKIKK